MHLDVLNHGLKMDTVTGHVMLVTVDGMLEIVQVRSLTSVSRLFTIYVYLYEHNTQPWLI